MLGVPVKFYSGGDVVLVHLDGDRHSEAHSYRVIHEHGRPLLECHETRRRYVLQSAGNPPYLALSQIETGAGRSLAAHLVQQSYNTGREYVGARPRTPEELEVNTEGLDAAQSRSHAQKARRANAKSRARESSRRERRAAKAKGRRALLAQALFTDGASLRASRQTALIERDLREYFDNPGREDVHGVTPAALVTYRELPSEEARQRFVQQMAVSIMKRTEPPTEELTPCNESDESEDGESASESDVDEDWDEVHLGAKDKEGASSRTIAGLNKQLSYSALVQLDSMMQNTPSHDDVVNSK